MTSEAVAATELSIARVRADYLLKELDHRREMRWRVFSWSSTLLTAITGGILALKASTGEGFGVWCWCSMALAIVSLSLYALFWLHFDLAFEKSLWDEVLVEAEACPELRGCLGACKLGERERSLAWRTYALALALLALAALLSTFVPLPVARV